VAILPAMKPSRHHIAAGVTVLALGILATVALASGGKPESGAATPAAQSTPDVRTEIVRETLHRRGKRASAGGASSSRSSGSSATSGRSAVQAASSPSAPAAVTVSHQRRGRGRDDAGFDDHGRHEAEHELEDHDDDGGHRGRGRGRGGDDD